MNRLGELGRWGHFTAAVLLLLCTVCGGSLAATCSVRDRNFLIEFRNQMTDADGVLASWKTATDCCTWQGIFCDANARVTGIDIDGRQMLTAKPQNFGMPLGNLRSTLKELSLVNIKVQFRISIPRVFFTLGKLEFLQILGCGFIGPIPNELGNLRLLQQLKIGGNRLSGGVPETISNLKELRILELRNNQLTTLGSSKLTLLKKLDRVDFSFNKISGSIPKWLGGLTLTGPFFNELLLSSNRLSGTIPAELCNIRGMRYLTLRGNKLRGAIPLGIGKCKLLQALHLGQNMLAGPLPRELGQLTKLIYLTADNNNLSGSLPRELGDLPELTFISLQNNKITGGIPSNYGPYDPLVTDPVNLTNNMLKGPIPKDMQYLGENAFRPGNPGLCGPPLSNPC